MELFPITFLFSIVKGEAILLLLAPFSLRQCLPFLFLIFSQDWLLLYLFRARLLLLLLVMLLLMLCLLIRLGGMSLMGRKSYWLWRRFLRGQEALEAVSLEGLLRNILILNIVLSFLAFVELFCLLQLLICLFLVNKCKCKFKILKMGKLNLMKKIKNYQNHKLYKIISRLLQKPFLCLKYFQ